MQLTVSVVVVVVVVVFGFFLGGVEKVLTYCCLNDSLCTAITVSFHPLEVLEKFILFSQKI